MAVVARLNRKLGSGRPGSQLRVLVIISHFTATGCPPDHTPETPFVLGGGVGVYKWTNKFFFFFKTLLRML